MVQYFSPKFFLLIDLKIFTFSYTWVSSRISRKTSFIPTYHGNSKKRIQLKDTAEKFIKTMEISINTDLHDLNNSSLI